MEQRPHLEQDHPPERIEFFQNQLRALEEELAVPEGVINDEMRQVGAEMLADIYGRHGDPTSETFKQYYNDKHALDVLRRAWNQLRLLKQEFPDLFTDHDYRLLFFAALGHDSIRGTGGDMGTDEEQSAEWTIAYMRRLDFDETDCERVREAIIVTTVKTREEDGAIIQTYVREGSKDPLKLIMAYADINGMLMGGLPAFANDSLNLYLDRHHLTASDIPSNRDSLKAFLGTQLQFVDTRIQELDSDYAFYFGKDAPRVSKLYYDSFTRATRNVYSAAKTINSKPHIMKLVIDDVTRVIESTEGDEQTKLAAAKKRIVLCFSS